MSNLLKHAERELRAAGLLESDSDYDGMLGEAVLELMGTFVEQGHSGFSGFMTAEIFAKLVAFQPLTPLTSNPEEWQDVSEFSGKPTWQSRRQPNAFSEDAGETWYTV